MQIKPIKVLFVTTYTKWDAPPMAAAYLYGYLKKNEAFELTFTGGYESDTELEDIIRKDSYEIIACGGMFIYMDYFKKVFEMAEKFCPEAKRISGGAAIEGLGAEYVFSNLNIHAAVIGEGEKTLEDLILAFRDQRDLSSVKGIAYRDSGNNLIRTAPRELIDLKQEDLQADYSFFDMELYFRMSGRRGFAILGSRGCPNRCNFCHSTFPGYRLRNTDEIVTEIKKFYDLYKLSYFSFGDETFASNIDKLKELCSKLKAAVPDARWGCGLRANIVNEEKLKIMKEGGCNFIQLGVESGSDRILKLMNKNTTAEQNLKAIQMIKKSGIQLGISIMYGYKDETEDDIRKTTDLLIQTNEIPEFHSHVTPVPGTVLFKQAESEGRIPDLTEYIKIMNRGIYIYNGLPALNLTRIPDSRYYSFLISEQRRLWTEHFRKNRAFVISYTEEGTEHFSVKNKCPHCGAESDSTVARNTWWTFCHCAQCSKNTGYRANFLRLTRLNHARLTG